MKKFIFKDCVRIPDSRKKDVKELQKYIVKDLRILISEKDTYKFWNKVSDYFDAGWLSIDFHYDDMTRGDFIIMMMEEFGVIEE